MANRIIEGLGRLPRQGAAGSVCDRSRNYHRQALPARLEGALDRDKRRLGVQRIEYSLDEQQIDAAIDKPVERLAVRQYQLVECDRAITRVVDIGRDRRGLIGRSEDPGDETRLLQSFC